MPFYELSEFIKLSAVLNYQLCAIPKNWDGVVNAILGDHTVSPEERAILKRTCEYLFDAYGDRKRLVGPLSVLHPLRGTAMLAQTSERSSFLDLMVALLHDLFEDIEPERSEKGSRSPLEKALGEVVEGMAPDDQWYLIERVGWLTKRKGEAYYPYIGRLLDHAHGTPEIVRVKLADRLDNTLDMRMDMMDFLEDTDGFEVIFQILSGRFKAPSRPEVPHPPVGIFNGADRLYQLFKDSVLMSLIRQKGAGKEDEVVRTIFDQLAGAGMREAQRIVLHIVEHHLTANIDLRGLVLNTLDYIDRGGIDRVTGPASGHSLDGLFVSYFDDPSKEVRKKKLGKLYLQKELMVQAALAFIAIFLSFRDDPDFYIRGVSEDGVKPDG